MSLGLATLALAQGAAAQTRVFNIPAGPAVSAIPEFGRQASVQIIAPADRLKDLRTPPLHGALDVHEALRRLLVGSGLEIAGDEAGLITLRAAPAPAQPLPPVKLGEVVVRATRRLERLQLVPIAVTTFNARAGLAMGVTDISSLETAVPGLEFSRYFNGATPTLRGVGSTTGIGAEEPAVAVYLDDVYLSSSSATIFSLNNIDHVEVLKGPQGTLFGRNATGGVIQIFSRKPSWRPSGDVSVGYANYDTVSGAFYGTTGVTDTLAADLAVVGLDQRAGWGRNLFTRQAAFTDQEAAARTKWLYQPSPTTSLTFSADYGFNRYSSGIAMSPVQGAIFEDGSGYQGFYNVSEAPTGYTDTRQGGVSAKVVHDAGPVELISISAYREVAAHVHADEDQTKLPLQDFVYVDGRKTLTEEIRLVSTAPSRLKWIVGFFYFHDDSALDPFVGTGTAFAPVSREEYRINQLTQSYAGFGEVTFDLGAGTRLTTGARYTYDVRRFKGVFYNDGAVVDAADKHSGNDASTYRLSLAHDFTPDATAYVSYSRGFKSGLYNIIDLHSGPVRPEFLDAFEAGFKSEWFDHRLRFNASAYLYKFHDLQVMTLVSNNGVTASILQNAAQSTNTGLDIDVQAAPTDRLTLRGGLALMHSVFDTFPDATLSRPNTALVNGVLVLTGGNSTFSGSASGNRTPHAPDLTASLSADYRVSTPVGDVVLTATESFNSGFYWDADNRLKQAPYDLLAATVAWTSSDLRWGFRLWAKNLLDARYSVYTTANVIGDEESPAPPRTFGATIERRF